MRCSYSFIAIGRNFTSAHAGYSLSMNNRPDTCASLHVYGHVATICILTLTNCYGITNLLLLSLKIRPFHEILILQKYGAIQ